jgi:hypothetical protein
MRALMLRNKHFVRRVPTSCPEIQNKDLAKVT